MRVAPRAYSTALAGGGLILLSAAWFICATAALARGLAAASSRDAGDAGPASARSDVYYALLVPLFVPVALVAAFLHWFALKLYRHS